MLRETMASSTTEMMIEKMLQWMLTHANVQQNAVLKQRLFRSFSLKRLHHHHQMTPFSRTLLLFHTFRSSATQPAHSPSRRSGRIGPATPPRFVCSSAEHSINKRTVNSALFNS
jgi:hypothetical protein